MTREQMISLAERLRYATRDVVTGERLDAGVYGHAPIEDLEEAAAALRQMAEQEPVECNPADYCTARHIKCYAAPVPAVDLAEWKRYAMRLHMDLATIEAFASHLEKLK